MSLRRALALLMAATLIVAIAMPATAYAAPRPVVSGTVYGSDGLAIPGATIQVSELFRGAFQPVTTITADANGQWTFTDKENTYRFDFSAPGADSQSHELVMLKGETYTLDVTLLSYGAITGVISDSATSAGVAGATIDFFRRNTDGTYPPMPALSTVTASDGSYSSGTLTAGTYAVKASASGYASSFLGGAVIELATPVSVLRAATSDASFALDALEGTGSISGVVVSGASRTPVGSAFIWLYKQKDDGTWPATSPGWGTPDYSLFSASDGTWTSGGIPLGNYRVRFFTIHTGSQWWQYVTTFDLATTLTLASDGQAITGIDGWFYMP